MLVIPVYNTVLLPDSTVYLNPEEVQSMTGKTLSIGDRVMLIPLREHAEKEHLTSDMFYSIGVEGEVTESVISGVLSVKTGNRLNVFDPIIMNDGTVMAAGERRPDILDSDPAEEQKRYDQLRDEILAFVKDSRFQAPVTMYFESGSHTLSDVACAMTFWITESAESKYKLLEEDSRKNRLAMVEKLVYESLQMVKLSTEGESERSEDYRKAYRENAIRHQMEYLQKELDEMHPENVSDVRRFEMKINESGMNETAEREARKVLNRMKQENQNSPETGMLYDYLDFVTGLQWKKQPAEEIDLDEAERILNEDHFGLRDVKDRIIQQIAVMNLRHEQSGSILLFVGAPGTGKTSIGQAIAQAVGRKYVRVSLGGVRDEADIRGHRRTYIGAMPGRIMDGIQKSGVSNPVMVLDEVDKLSASYNGDPASALLEVLDPEQNATFTDHYMNVPYDLSSVMFICTANTTDTIPEPLLNRMEVIHFQGYSAQDKLQIARRHLLPKAMKSMGIGTEDLVVDDEVLREIIDKYTMEAGVRGLKKRLDSLCRQAAVAIVRSGHDQLTIHTDNLRDFMDGHPIRHGRVLEHTSPGIVTGLAWTAAGGEMLYIETLLSKGKGGMLLTGKLGDVMKESAQIALSVVKSLFPEEAGKLENQDLHIHVPEGAVPKDGPSAGVTMAVALSSLITGKKVPADLAMTGELALRGAVTAIGGLPEKLMAAVRGGVKKVLIPEENMDDLRDVSEEIRNQLEIVPVKSVSDALKEAGIL